VCVKQYTTSHSKINASMRP